MLLGPPGIPRQFVDPDILPFSLQLIPVAYAAGQDLENCQSSRLPWLIDSSGMGIQLLRQLPVSIRMEIELTCVLECCLQSFSEAFNHSCLFCVVIVEFHAEVAQAKALHPVLHYFQGCEFLGYEKNCLAFVDGGCDQVGDRLGLSGAGRALDDEIFSLDSIDQR